MPDQVYLFIFFFLYFADRATQYTEWPKRMYTLFTHQYLWNKFK